jgi:hypothetical protein
VALALADKASSSFFLSGDTNTCWQKASPVIKNKKMPVSSEVNLILICLSIIKNFAHIDISPSSFTGFYIQKLPVYRDILLKYGYAQNQTSETKRILFFYVSFFY